MKKTFGVVIFVFSTFVTVWLLQPVRLIVENETPESVDGVNVLVGGHKIEFGSLAPGERKESWFFYKGSDSAFNILANNSRINETVGYMTQGVGVETVIIEFQKDRKINYVHGP